VSIWMSSWCRWAALACQQVYKILKMGGHALHILYNSAPSFAYRNSCVIHYAVSDGAVAE
jgi:hypothetical protein